MNIIERFFGARQRHGFTKAASLLAQRRCPVCGAGWQSIGVASKGGKVERPKEASAASLTIFSCENCGSRWTAPAAEADWHPRIRMTVLRRQQTHPGSDEPKEVCEILSDGVDGLMKVEEAAEKDQLSEVFGVPHYRFTHGGQTPDGEMFDAGRELGAFEEENLRHIALYDLLFKPYYVGQFICDGAEDPVIRERAAEVRLVEASLRKPQQDPSKTSRANDRKA